MREVYTRAKVEGEQLKGGEIIPVPSFDTHELPLPLESLAHITDFGFDVEETIVTHLPWHLATNFAHFLLWEASGESIDPTGSLRAFPAVHTLLEKGMEEKQAAWRDHRDQWEQYQTATWTALREQYGDEALLARAIFDFVHLTYSDDVRGAAAAKLLGLETPAEAMQRYGRFWKEGFGDDFEALADAAPSGPIPGAIDTLNLLAGKGKRIHFITNAEGARIKVHLEKYLPIHGFTGSYNLVSARDLGESKPKPAAFQKVYNDIGLSPTETLSGRYPFVYFGNGVSDVVGAHNAQAAIAGFVNPFVVDSAKYRLPAHYQMRDLRPLHKVLRGNFA